MDVARQRTAQFVNPRRQRLEVVAVLNARVLDDLFQPFAVEPDRVHAQDGVVVVGGEFGRRRSLTSLSTSSLTLIPACSTA